VAKNEEQDVEGTPADGEGVTPLDDEGEKKGLTAKKLLMIIVPILVLAVAATLYFTGVLGPKKDDTKKEGTETAATAEGGEGAEGAEGATPGATFMEVPDLLVNLSGTGGQARFLKLKVKLEVNSPADEKALEAVAPRVVDQFQTFLREMRVQDMRGSAGIYRLRQELLYRVNLAAAPVKVKDVLFQEILIQ